MANNMQLASRMCFPESYLVIYFTIFENNTKIKIELYVPFNMVSKDECPDINKHSLLPQKRQNEYMILTKQ